MRAKSILRGPFVTNLARVSVFVGFLEVKLLFGYLRALADNGGFPHQHHVLPAIDHVIGFGETPGQRLQSWFFTGHITPFDTFWLGIYDSWFLVPTVLTLYIIVFRWDVIASYASVRLAVYLLLLPIYFLMPSEPPWMAIHALRIAALAPGGVPVDGNPFAAFPSMHVLTPAVLAFWLWWKRIDVMAIVFSVYTALTIFAVLYLGEHYLIDVVTSLVLAGAIVQAAGWVERALLVRRSRPEPATARVCVAALSNAENTAA